MNLHYFHHQSVVRVDAFENLKVFFLYKKALKLQKKGLLPPLPYTHLTVQMDRSLILDNSWLRSAMLKLAFETIDHMCTNGIG